MLAGGGDYELLFTAPAFKRTKIEALGKDRESARPHRRRGTGRSRGEVRDARGKLVSSRRKGFDHFA
jgi:thiamine monophosphate kinase